MIPETDFRTLSQVSLMSKTPLRTLARGKSGPRCGPIEYSSTSITLDEMVFSRFPKDYEGHVAQHFVLKNVRVMSGHSGDGVVIDSNGCLIAETAHFSQFRSDPDLLAGRCVQHETIVEKLAIFFDSAWTTYYHFLIFGIGNVLRFMNDLPNDVPILLPNTNAAYQKSCVSIQEKTVVELLELATRDRSTLNLPAGIHNVSELHLFWSNTPSSAGIIETVNFLAPLHELAAAVRSSRSSKPRRRLLIKRAGPNSRMTNDEMALATHLSNDQGFETLVLEDLSFNQQMSACAHAEVIVAPHGAGLANLVFCDPSCLIVEFNRLLGDQVHLRPWFYQLATESRMPYAGFNLDKGEAALKDAFAFIRSTL